MKNPIGMWFVYIDPVSQAPDGFEMGSADKELGREDDETLHHVKLTKGYYIGRTEVTQAQWQAVMGFNRSHYRDDENIPVGRVSWDECQAFCAKLTEKYPGTYRLPTEAEWEYACRAGSVASYSGTAPLDQVSWRSTNSDGRPHPVAQKLPSDWGLFDMHGNVSEWCQDWYGTDYYKDPSAGLDPTGPESGENRVMRGGSYYFARGRSAQRGSGPPDVKADNVGFRVVVEPSR